MDDLEGGRLLSGGYFTSGQPSGKQEKTDNQQDLTLLMSGVEWQGIS